MKEFSKFCAISAARLCFDSGQSVKNIANSAKKSERTIYRWLKLTARN